MFTVLSFQQSSVLFEGKIVVLDLCWRNKKLLSSPSWPDVSAMPCYVDDPLHFFCHSFCTFYSEPVRALEVAPVETPCWDYSSLCFAGTYPKEPWSIWMLSGSTCRSWCPSIFCPLQTRLYLIGGVFLFFWGVYNTTETQTSHWSDYEYEFCHE